MTRTRKYLTTLTVGLVVGTVAVEVARTKAAPSSAFKMYHISGHILDNEGKPISGVLVEYEGTYRLGIFTVNYTGVVKSDEDGLYVIEVPETWHGRTWAHYEGEYDGPFIPTTQPQPDPPPPNPPRDGPQGGVSDTQPTLGHPR